MTGLSLHLRRSQRSIHTIFNHHEITMLATITHFIPIPIIDSSEFTLWSAFNNPPASSAWALRFAEASYVDFFRKSWLENFLRFIHFRLLPCQFSLFHLSYFLSHYFFSFISFFVLLFHLSYFLSHFLFSFLIFFFHFSHCFFSFLFFFFYFSC